MNNVGLRETHTRQQVIDLFRDALGYDYPVNWKAKRRARVTLPFIRLEISPIVMTAFNVELLPSHAKGG